MNPTDSKLGRYDLSVFTSTKDKLGQEVRATVEGSLKLQALPTWLLLLIILGAILLLAALIAFILTRKVLPPKMSVDDVVFRAGSKTIPITFDDSYVGKLRKNGAFSFYINPPPANPTAIAGFSLDLQAESNLMKVLPGIFKRNYDRCVVIRTGISSDASVKTIRMSGVTTTFNAGDPVTTEGKPLPTPDITDATSFEITGSTKKGRYQVTGKIYFH